jgi:hypothetical protein
MSRIRSKAKNPKLLTVEEATKETSLPREALMARQAVFYHSMQ